MKPFMNSVESSRRREARRLACNPAPGRTSKHYQRITRTLELIAARIRLHLESTQFGDRKWLPSEGVITEKDDDWQHDLAAQYIHKYNVEDDGYLIDWHDPSIKATNRILAVTWYENAEGGGFIIKKPVYCPLPCEQWGRLAITLKQWRVIAPMLIESGMLWQWVHAVRHYTTDDTFVPAKIVGWHLEPANAVTSIQRLKDSGDGTVLDFRSVEEQEQDADGWIGRVIYQDITSGFSLDD